MIRLKLYCIGAVAVLLGLALLHAQTTLTTALKPGFCTTDYPGVANNSGTLMAVYQSNALVFKNGVLQHLGSDYSIAAGTHFLVQKTGPGDLVEVVQVCMH